MASKSRQLNPFIDGRPAPSSHFIGRETIIDNCYNRLAGPVRTSIAISGEHGIGKTSLLQHLIHIAEEEQWGQPYTQNVFIYLDCHIKNFNPTRFWQRVLEELEQGQIHPGLKAEISPLLEAEEIDAPQIQRLLRWLNRQRLSLILLLDSFTHIVDLQKQNQAMISHFLASLRALINLPDSALTLLTATRQPLNKLCEDIVKNYPGSHFYNNFAFESLTAFTPEEASLLLDSYLENSAIHFNEDDCDFLKNVAGSHPALLQMAAYHLFESYRQDIRPDARYKRTLESFIQAAGHYFKVFWEESTPTERSLFVLLTLKQLPDLSYSKDSINKHEIENHLQTYERYLLQMFERGLLGLEAKQFQLSSKVFMWWIVREVAQPKDSASPQGLGSIGDEFLLEAWKQLRLLAPSLTLDRLTYTLTPRSAKPKTSEPDSTNTSVKSQSENTELLLSRYQLQKVLGRGANGTVRKAFDTLLKRTVAIKILHPSHSLSQADNRSKLLKEAQAASQLQHPNIVIIHDVSETDREIFLVMEYLAGQTLAEILDQQGKIPVPDILAYLQQTALALDYAHRQNIIHRDIKPANLIIRDDGQVKLTDFGIAKILNDPNSAQSSHSPGTLMYMSPEQIDNQTIDGRSDLFSLAVVAYQMFSGSTALGGRWLWRFNRRYHHQPLYSPKTVAYSLSRQFRASVQPSPG